jgi:ribosomal protein S6
MQVHDNALNLTSELRKKRTLNVQYFFMKIHASAWQCIESHIWTKKKVDFESSILFHENSCKCMTMHWISHLNYEKSELWKFNIFSWKFMQGHDNALNLTSELRKKWILKGQYFFMKIHASALNLTSELRKKWTLKGQYFFMKIHASALNSISELRKKFTLKVQYFFMKIHARAWQCIESHIWTKEKVNY